MQRGTNLEPEAVQLFIDEMLEVHGTPVEEWETGLVIWQHDIHTDIALSPDCYHIDGEIAVEVKCLNSGEHIKAFLTKEVPDQYEEQVVQYFVVNEKLETLYFVMYDPRMSVQSFFYLVVTRSAMQTKIDDYYTQQVNMLDRVNATVTNLTSNLF